MREVAGFFRCPAVLLVTAILLGQAAAFHKFARHEKEPLTLPFRLLPAELGEWRAQGDEPLDDYAAKVLHPDDYLRRYYADARGLAAAQCFIAYFRTQRTGHVPHSPKNCLPGHGWAPDKSGPVALRVPGREVTVNRYVVAKENVRAVVLYWYQTPRRALADEYLAKIYLVWDAIRDGRSDTALVRVMVPFGEDGEAAAERSALNFSERLYEAVAAHMGTP